MRIYLGNMGIEWDAIGDIISNIGFHHDKGMFHETL